MKCVVCGKKALETPVTIAIGGDTRVFHLCRDDRGPIDELFNLGTPEPNGATPTAVVNTAHRVEAFDWKPGQ